MSSQSTLNIGFGNRVVVSRIVGILIPGSSPMRRLKDEARNDGRLANATQGRRCRSILLTDSGHLLLSAVHADTLAQRLEAISCEKEEAGTRIVASRVVALLIPSSSPMERLKREARKARRLVDTTRGRKCRSILLADSGHVILSCVHPDTMSKRLHIVSSDLSEFPENPDNDPQTC